MLVEMSPRLILDEQWLAWLNGPSVDQSLRAVHHFRRRIVQREGEIVRAARAQGWSWYTIGDWLGVPYQSVHKRWARKIEAAITADNEARANAPPWPEGWLEEFIGLPE